MQAITLQTALQAIALQQNSTTITAQAIEQLLQHCSVTFAQLLYVTQVQLAAKHKQQQIYKVTSANVMLASNVAAHTDIYARRVRKTAGAIAANSAQAVADFTAQGNYFEHSGTCYCIVAHKQYADRLYLYAIYNRAQSVYVHDGAIVQKQHVAQYCTASAAQQLLHGGNTVVNKTHNIEHAAHVRTIALSNIVQITARKQLLRV